MLSYLFSCSILYTHYYLYAFIFNKGLQINFPLHIEVPLPTLKCTYIF